MAYQDQFYTLGTIALTNGQTAVTGTDTGWQTALIVGGVLYAGGGAYPIASVNSETSLTLAIPYTGATAANTSYAIDRQRSAATSNVAMNDRLAQIIRELQIGNIEALNSLESVDNLAELAALQKANSRFLVIDATGVFGLLPLDNKLNKPEGATNIHLIDGTGAATRKIDLPVQTAVQNALDNKADKWATENALGGKLNLSGGQMTGTVNGKTPPNSGNNQHGFYCGASFGSYDSSYSRSAPFATFANSAGNQFSLSYKMLYAHAASGNPGVTYSGMYAFGVLNYGNTSPGSLNLVHANADNQAIKTWQFDGNNGGLSIPGPVSKASGTWKIDHPLDPANKILRHGFVEAPEYVNIYRGVVRLVNGKATVNIDEYFGMMFGTFWAVNTDIMVSALQNQEGGTVVWPEGKMTGGILNITCADETCNDEIAWMVTGRRRDPYVILVDPNCERGTGRFIPEIDKED